MRATSVVALAAVFAPAVLAGPFFTAPVSGTVCKARELCVVTWNDDGKAPTLAEFGDATLALCTGSAQMQTCLQQLSGANAATSTVQFFPDPTVGEDSTAYFIKMISVNTADPATPQYKATAYSAMFSLSGMTGKFNETIQAQIAGTAPSPSAGAGAATTVVTVTSTSSASGASKALVTSKTSSAAATGTAATANTNGAASVAVGAGMFGATVLAALAAIF